MEPFIGQLIMFGGNFAPRGWALCDGQLLPIAQNQALFSILGTTYGGDGRTTFGLPDLRGRVPIHAGTGPGLTAKRLGAKGGVETVTLNVNQIPSHNHGLTNANVKVGGEGKGAVKTDNPSGAFISSIAGGFTTSAGAGSLGGSPNGPSDAAGGGTSHENMAPYQVVNYIIALMGTYPSRS